MVVYPAIFKKVDNGYMVRFPDIPEAMTEGDTINQAYEMAIEVLGLALEDYHIFPKPSAYHSIQQKYPNSIITLVEIDLKDYRSQYVSESLK